MAGGVPLAFMVKHRFKRRFKSNFKTATKAEADLVFNFKGEIGAPGTIRTSDPQIRSLMLYPAELRARTA
jgi:hypothetical protein